METNEMSEMLKKILKVDTLGNYRPHENCGVRRKSW